MRDKNIIVVKSLLEFESKLRYTEKYEDYKKKLIAKILLIL